jgi:hypothetical protein
MAPLMNARKPLIDILKRGINISGTIQNAPGIRFGERK